MAFLQLASTNENLSYLIGKNPTTPMLIKSIRKGHGFGYFTKGKNTEYNVYFKDAENDLSYKLSENDVFEYINTTRYNSPFAYFNLLNDFFNSALKKDSEYENAEDRYEIALNMVFVKDAKLLGYFSKYFEDVNLEFENLIHKNYKVKVTTQKSLRYLLNYTILLLIIVGMVNEENMYVDESLIEKTINAACFVNAPYYIRYHIKNKFLNSHQLFNRFRSKLEETNLHKIEFAFGNTWVNRFDAIEKHFGYNNHIVDIGCGEGRYATKLADRLNDKKYFAIERDEQVLKTLNLRLSRKKSDNVLVFPSFTEFKNQMDKAEDYDILMTEVIEHMELPEAKNLLVEVLETAPSRLIVTTPNADFNQFYLLEGVRNEDHKFEMNEADFQNWIKALVNADKFNCRFLDIGDKVNGIATTQGVIIERV